MMKQARIATRPPVKQEYILQELRRQIVEGRLPPGSQLPVRGELEQQFQVSSMTVQRALDRLIRDGFVRALGPKGTYVSEHPPHLAHYGVVFPHQPSHHHEWRRFWTALVNEGMSIQKAGPRSVSTYYGVDGHVDTEDYQKAVRDVRAGRLAGLIFASPPHLLVGTPLLDAPDLPRVAITGVPGVAGIPAVKLSGESFMDRALDLLVARGCRRVAVLSVPGYDPERFVAGLEARRLETRPYWLQTVSPSHPEAAKNCVHLLMHGEQSVRPDGLVIADDNLVEHATGGLVAAGARVPGDLHVVAHCNFPWPTPSVLPVQRLGYDARKVLAACLDSIDRQRRGDAVPDVTVVDAVFEHELPAARA